MKKHLGMIKHSINRYITYYYNNDNNTESTKYDIYVTGPCSLAVGF